MSHFQTASETQGVGAELVEARTGFLVKSHIGLPQTFHVVHVHTHHMSQSVGQEKRMCTVLHGLFGIALHKSEFLETFGHQAAYIEVDVEILHTGLGMGEGQVMAVNHDVVDFALLGAELSADRRGPGVVGAVVFHRFGTSITKEQASGFEHTLRGISMKNLAMHGDNALETADAAVTGGNAVELSADEGLGHPGLYSELHGSGMHEIADVRGTFQLCNFLGTLDAAQFHDSLYEFEACSLLLLGRMDAEKVHQLNLVVGTVGRKEMHFPTLCACFAAFFGEPCHRFHLGDTRLGGHFTDAGHASVPDDVVDVDFITYKGLLAGLAIDDECQTVAVLSGEIEEAGVLTELICVGRIVHG